MNQSPQTMSDTAEAGPSDGSPIESVLVWAASKRVPVTVSLEQDGCWQNIRTHLVEFDANEKLLKLELTPAAGEGRDAIVVAPPGLQVSAGQLVGMTFRRGHKKCVFVTRVVVIQEAEAGESGCTTQMLVLRAPRDVKELQRRSYQRITLPPDQFVAVRLWQGGLPSKEHSVGPSCSGRVGNISLGGILIDIRKEHNPRLTVGENVGVEITPRPGSAPLLIEGQYRHCVITGDDRLGLGVQFLGLERERPGCSTLADVNAFIGDVRRFATRGNWFA